MVMYELLDLKWITKKDLLYSTWNSAQYYTAVQMGGGFFFFFFEGVGNGYMYMHG